MTDELYLEVCVAASPLRSAGENATAMLLEILSTIAIVSIVATKLSDGLAIRD